MEKSGYLDDLDYLIAEGKESVVIKGHYAGGDLAIKIYRVMNINWRDFHRYLRQDRRFKGVRWTKVEIINEWVRREYSNLMRAYKNGVNVPRPIFYRGNVLASEFIGDKLPAPKLKDIYIEEVDSLVEQLEKNLINLVKKAKLVHGDLSPFNILYYEGKPYIIDVSQSIPIDSPEALTLLKRDIANLNFYLKRYKERISEDVEKELIEYIEALHREDLFKEEYLDDLKMLKDYASDL